MREIIENETIVMHQKLQQILKPRARTKYDALRRRQHGTDSILDIVIESKQIGRAISFQLALLLLLLPLLLLWFFPVCDLVLIQRFTLV